MPTAAKSPGAPPADSWGRDETWGGDEENWEGNGYGDDSRRRKGEDWHGGSRRQDGGSRKQDGG
eukprot:15477856-Alexandrium_andersonii.AAC.1